MAFLVQRRSLLNPNLFRTYEAVIVPAGERSCEFRAGNEFGLWWAIISIHDPRVLGDARDARLPLVDDAVSAPITLEEAELATGLYAPACWDKILEEI